MGIGGSIALMVIGAILAFAVKNTSLGGVIDLNVVGWILILAGLVGLVLTLWVWNSRRTRVVSSRSTGAAGYVAPAPEQQVVEERRIETDRNY
jgi:hypothetical protein